MTATMLGLTFLYLLDLAESINYVSVYLRHQGLFLYTEGNSLRASCSH